MVIDFSTRSSLIKYKQTIEHFFILQNKDIFTKDQLIELEKTNLSKIVCNNGDNIKSISKSIFLLTKPNDWVDCNIFEDLDLNKW